MTAANLTKTDQGNNNRLRGDQNRKKIYVSRSF